MLAAAVLLVGCLLVVAWPLPSRLARAAWPAREPALALLLWQAMGLAGGLLCLALAITLALAPLGSTWGAALAALGRGLPWTSWLALAVGLAILLRLASVLVASTTRTLTARRRNRQLVDLVGEPNLLLRGTSIVDHEVPVAYCLPGGQPRLVLSRGTLSLLTFPELSAVLAHERAHLDQRHDLVVLPFVALGATFPRLPSVPLASRQVRLLVELLADDRAARTHNRNSLASALWKIGTAGAPPGSLGAGGSDVVLRAERLLAPPSRMSPRGRAAVVALTTAVALSPALGPVVPLLLR